MRIIIFGATGSIGRLLVEQALAKGHMVTAFLRDPSKLSISHSNLKEIQGDVLSFATVEDAIRNQDVVFCALGDGNKGKLRAEGTKNILLAMQKTGVNRFICQTSLGVGDSRSNLNFFWKHIMFGLLLKKAYQDHETQEKYIMQSTLDWVIVRPAAFTNGPHTGRYRHGFNADDKTITLKISRADVADFMLRQITDNRYIRKTPGLSY
jgi:putative NADH-flavin reductase